MSEFQKINSFIDLQATEAEKKAFLKQVEDIMKGLSGIGKIEVKLQGDKGVKDTVSSMGELKKKQDELTLATKEYEKIANQLATTQAKLNAAESQAAKDLAESKNQLQQRNAAIKDEIKLNQAAEGSINQKRVQLKQLQAQYDALGAAERKAATGGTLLKEIQKLDKELKSLEGSTGRFQRNVGNYSGAVKTLEKALGEVKKKMDDFNNSGNANSQVLEQLIKEEQLLTQLVESQANGFASATSELKNNEKALMALSAAGLESTEFYKELLKQTANLKDNVGDLKAEIKNLSSDTKLLDGLVGSAQVLASTYGIAQGAAALFGDENEQLQKTFVKLQAVTTILTGLQSIQNALQKESSVLLFAQTARTTALAAAQKLYTFATGGATVATNALRTALIATGIGAILVLISSAASAMSSFASSTKDSADAADGLKISLDNLNESFDDLISNQERQNKLAIAQAKANGAGDATILALESKGIEERRKLLIEKKKILDNQYNNENLSAKELADLNKDRLALQGAIADAESEIEIKRLDSIARNNEKRNELGKKAAEDRKKALEAERAAQFELAKILQDESARGLEDVANNDANGYQERIDALNQAKVIRAGIIIAERDFELKNAELTAGQRLLIEQKALVALRDLENENAKQSAEIAKQTGDQQKAEREKAINDSIKLEEEAFANRIALLETQRDTELLAISDAVASGQMSQEDAAKKRLKIQQGFQAESLESELTYYEKLADVMKGFGIDTVEIEKKIAAARLAISATGNSEKEFEAEKARIGKLKELYKDLANEVGETFKSIITGAFERQKNAIQEQIDLVELRKAKDIEAAQVAIGTEEEKAARVALINARAQTQKEALERRQRQIDVQRARFEKAFNIAKVIADTASAIVNQLKLTPLPAGAPLAAAIGAIGAIQLARIIATPIPKYAEGTDDHQGGLAWVGDGGKRELVITPSGKVTVTPNTPTLMDLPKHSVVLPDVDKLKAGAFMNPGMAPLESDRTMAEVYAKYGEKMIKAIQNQPRTVVKNTHAGWELSHQRGKDWLTYIHQNTQF